MALYDQILDALRLFNLRSVIDILLIAALIYGALLPLRHTAAMSVLRGIGLLVIAVLIVAQALNLLVLNWLISRSITGLIIAVPIIFQPEIRRTMERVGRTGFRAWASPPSYYEGVITLVTDTALRLAAQRYGALLLLERETALREYIETGVRLDARVSTALLEGLFFPNSPLHDGAVILREDRVLAAGCTLPLSERPVPGHSGTRHRAALGVTEQTDAVAIVISEEMGTVSVATQGRIITDLDEASLRVLLASLLGTAGAGSGGDGRERAQSRASTRRAD